MHQIQKGIDNMKNIYEFYSCPIEDYNCPYCNANAECMMNSPQEECDDFIAVYENVTIDPEG